MKAIIQTQGRQFLVKAGDVLFVNRYQDSNAGDLIDLKEVLMIGEAGKTTVGTPFVPNACVKARILENKRAKKILIYKKKRRKGYERKRGHRQEISVVRIETLALN